MSPRVQDESSTMVRAFPCPRCGSTAVRKSMPRSAGERLVRAWTPYHYFLCRDCEYRGHHLGPVPTTPGSDADRITSRPLEYRDRQEAQRRARRLVVSICVAATMGAASGLYLHGCRYRSELEATTEAGVEGR
jgi:hypothetical protein